MAHVVKQKKLPNLSSGFFQTDIDLLRSIALKTNSFTILASYLALARHGNGIDENEPYRFTGAGINAVMRYTKVGEQSARNNIDTLLDLGFITMLPKEQISKSKRYMLTHKDLNLSLPWALVVDSINTKNTAIDSALTRIQKTITDDQVKLDALMILLNCYRSNILEMLETGGIDPNTTIFNSWISRSINKGDYREWHSEQECTRCYPQFMSSCLSYRNLVKQKKLSNKFWQAWNKLVELGLLYEAVTIFYDKFATLTLRVNDFHADTSSADPSYMRELNLQYGTEYQFYETSSSPNSNLEDEQVKMRVALPNHYDSEKYKVIGVFRPRFRLSTLDIAQWIERENEHIYQTFEDINDVISDI